MEDMKIFRPLFLSSLSNALTMTSVSNFIVQKVCSPSGEPDINEFICNDQDLIAQATGITIAKSTARSVLAAISSPIFGYHRDISGKSRRLLFVGELGELVAVLVYLTASWFWSAPVFLAAALEAVVGGLFGVEVFRLGTDCLIIEGSKPQERTMRLQLVHSSTFVAFLLATIIRGLFLTAVGYRWYFLLVACLHLCSIALIRTCVPDLRRALPKKMDGQDKKENMISKLRSALRPRPNSNVIWLMLICKPFFITFFQAEMIIGPYFLQQAFQFTVKEETLHGAYCMVINLLCSFTMPMLLIKVLKLSDFKIGVLSSMLAILTSISMAFVRTRTVLYMIPLLDVLKYNLFSLPQAILSKCIRNDELGTFSGISSVLGVFLPFGIHYLYKTTFSATSQTMPGAIYLISAAGNTIVMILYCASCYLYNHPEKSGEEDSVVDKKDKLSKKID